MSLNRRIFQWLLNVNSDGQQVNQMDKSVSREEDVTDEDDGVAIQLSAKCQPIYETKPGSLHIRCQHFHGVSMGGSSTWDKVEVEQEDSRPEEVNLLPCNCQLRNI